MSIYTTLVALSLSLGFWIGTRVRNRTHDHDLANLKSRTELVGQAALLQSRTSTVNDNSTSLRVNATDSCKMVGPKLPVVHPEPFIYYRYLSFGRIWE